MTCISKFGAAGRPRAPRHFAGPRLSAALRADPQRRDRAGATYHDWPAANRGRLQGACVAARRRNQVESKFRSGKANDCVVSRVPATRRRSLIALELLGRLVISAPSGRRPPLECHLKCANGSTVSTARCSRRRSQAFSSTDAKVARENGVGTGPDLASAGGVVAPSAVADELCDRDVAGDVRAGCVLEFKLAAAARLHQIV